MICAGVGSSFPACANFVSRAVLVRTQVRAATHYALGGARFAGIVAIGGTLRIADRLLSGCNRGVVIMPIPIRTPLPDVARHVVQSLAVGRERADRRCRAV